MRDEGAFAAMCDDRGPQFGLTKREYFAAAALQGTLANPETSDSSSNELIAKFSVAMADALIDALNDEAPE